MIQPIPCPHCPQGHWTWARAMECALNYELWRMRQCPGWAPATTATTDATTNTVAVPRG